MQNFPEIITEIPGPVSKELTKLLKKNEAPTITFASKNGPIFWRKAEGINVWDVDHNRFVDFTSAFGVASLGHNHPRVVAAVQKQSGLLCHAMGDVYPSEHKAKLCAKLSELTFERWTMKRQFGQTILCNAGFEAVEVALKTAKLFTGKRGVIAFEGAYHGLGYGALETTFRSDFRRPFTDQLGHFVQFVPFPRASGKSDSEIENELKQLGRQIKETLHEREIGAILVEPFQGRAGEVIPPDGFLRMLREICDKNRILLIVDEIYVGLWRTGRFFASEHAAVVPDIICLGKSLSGTLPISACVGRADIMSAWPESKGEALHTSTFLGNPLACVAALASLVVFEAELIKWKVLEKGKQFLEKLRSQLSGKFGITDIRGVGLLVGIEFESNAPIQPATLCDKLLKKGMIVLPSGPKGETLSLCPPLCVSEEILNWAVQQIAEQLSS